MSNVDDFLNLVDEWQLNHPDICPRCGCSMVDNSEFSMESNIDLCFRCFMDELPVLEEDFSNWAIVVACRAVCGANIKLF